MQIQYNLFITRFIIADIKYTTTSTGVGYGSGFELTKDTPYLALTGELWDVFCEYFDEKRSCYKGVLLYASSDISIKINSHIICVCMFPISQNMLKKRAAPSQPAVARPSPAQVMANRLKEIQQQAREAKERLMARRNSNLPTSPPGRTRVAHLPKPMSPTKSPEQAPTPCGTQDKVKPGKRKAHVPSEVSGIMG